MSGAGAVVSISSATAADAVKERRIFIGKYPPSCLLRRLRLHDFDRHAGRGAVYDLDLVLLAAHQLDHRAADLDVEGRALTARRRLVVIEGIGMRGRAVVARAAARAG